MVSQALVQKISGARGGWICSSDTEAGAPLLAIALADCWTKAAAQRCPAVNAALTAAARRNPGAEVLTRESTWIAVHLLYQRKHSTEESLVSQLRQIFAGEDGPLLSWKDQELDFLQGSFWCEEGHRQKRLVQMEAAELCEELGPEVCGHLGITESGYQLAIRYLASHAVAFPETLVLQPGGLGYGAKDAVEGLQLVELEGRQVLVALASKRYTQGEAVCLNHRGRCVPSGARLATCGTLPDDNESHSEGTWPYEAVTINVRFSTDGEVDGPWLQLNDSLRKDVERLRPPQAGLPRCTTPIYTSDPVAVDVAGVTARVQLASRPRLPSARSLQLLGRLALMDVSRLKDIMMLECAWDDIEAPAQCQHRGLRILSEAMEEALAKYPLQDQLVLDKAVSHRQRLCFKLLAAEKKVLEGAIAAAHVQLRTMKESGDSDASDAAVMTPAIETPFAMESDGLLKALRNIAQAFQAEVPIADGQQLQQELEVILALLRYRSIEVSKIQGPTSLSEAEVAALKALLASKLWEESMKADSQRRLEVASLRFQLGDFSQALEDLTLLVEEDPSNNKAIGLLELCEIQVAREVREKAGLFYSFDWSDGQEAERVPEDQVFASPVLQERSAQVGLVPRSQRSRRVCLDRRGFGKQQRWGLCLRESVVGLEVEDILPGIVKDCNFAEPGAAICVGDKILEVNGVRPSRHSSALAMLAEMSKEVLHLLLAPQGDHFMAPLKSSFREDAKRPLKTENRTWTDAVQNELLGFSPPCLCDWLWHEERIATFRKWSGDWRSATIQLDGCTWTAEVDDVFSKGMKSEERIQFRAGQRSLQSVSDFDMIIVPLILDEEVEDMTELPVQVRSFLAELEDLDVDSLCIVVLTAGGNGPECSGARNDGFGMPAAAPLRGMFRCFRLENPEMPILHLDSDALVLPGKTAELEEQITSELMMSPTTVQASALTFLGREVAYRKQRRFVPKLDISRAPDGCTPTGEAHNGGGSVRGLGRANAEASHRKHSDLTHELDISRAPEKWRGGADAGGIAVRGRAEEGGSGGFGNTYAQAQVADRKGGSSTPELDISRAPDGCTPPSEAYNGGISLRGLGRANAEVAQRKYGDLAHGRSTATAAGARDGAAVITGRGGGAEDSGSGGLASANAEASHRKHSDLTHELSTATGAGGAGDSGSGGRRNPAAQVADRKQDDLAPELSIATAAGARNGASVIPGRGGSAKDDGSGGPRHAAAEVAERKRDHFVPALSTARGAGARDGASEITGRGGGAEDGGSGGPRNAAVEVADRKQDHFIPALSTATGAGGAEDSGSGGLRNPAAQVADRKQDDLAPELDMGREASMSRATADGALITGSGGHRNTAAELGDRKQDHFVPELDICREVDKGHETSATRSEDGVALITGGSGGLGITTAEALVEYGVRHLVLCSRSGRVSADAPGQLLQRLEKLKETATVTLEACDASQEDQVVALLEKIRTTCGPLRWVVNAAGIVLPKDDADHLKAVFLPKCLGAWNLHRLTLPDDLEAMWFFSSLSGGVGTEGLYNYASANTYLDELARMRRSMALPAVSIQFPEVEEAGMAAAYVRSGAATVSLATVRRALQQLLRQPSSPVVALIPSGYLIARSVYHWLALQPLEARRNKDLWKQMERIEKENKEEVKELRKEIRNRKESNVRLHS